MALSMKKFNCEQFTLTIRFNESTFKKKDFLDDIKPKDKDIKHTFFFYGSKIQEDKEDKDHSHLELYLNKKNSFLRIIYHQGESPSEDVREPYMEDCSKWIAQFFKRKNLATDYTVVFRYDENYEAIVPLQYPLLTSNKNLKAVTVSGYQIEFPKEALIDTAFISSKKEEKLIMLSTEIKNFELLERNFYSNLEEFSRFAEAFVNEKGEK